MTHVHELMAKGSQYKKRGIDSEQPILGKEFLRQMLDSS
jgi:hypothetical protein